MIRQAIGELRAGDRTPDDGTNTGFLTLLAARSVGDSRLVIAVEPSWREFEKLLTKLILNQPYNVLALNLAGGEEPGISQLKIEPDHTGLNRIYCNDESPSGRQHCQVLALPALGLGEIALVKVDTEGLELFTLRGHELLLRNQQIRKLIAEISPLFLQLHKQNASDIYEPLKKHGYRPTIGP